MAVFMFGRSGDSFVVNSTFSENTWEKIIEACQLDKVPDSWVVGDQKAMTINGTQYMIDIIGKYHDTYGDGVGTAPLTFQLHTCYSKMAAMNSASSGNVGGWEDCAMRNSTLPSYLNLMPAAVKANVREVKKTTNGGSALNVIITTRDKLFLLSQIEVVGTSNLSRAGEGVQYEYYKTASRRIKTRSGQEHAWWLRSPYYNTADDFCEVYENGAVGYSDASADSGVSFAFCF